MRRDSASQSLELVSLAWHGSICTAQVCDIGWATAKSLNGRMQLRPAQFGEIHRRPLP